MSDDSFFQYTCVSRGVAQGEVFVAQARKPHLDILLVGLGFNFFTTFDKPFTQQAMEPYNIATRVEQAGLSYTMTVVDHDRVVLDDFHSRRKIHFPASLMYANKDWIAYAQTLGVGLDEMEPELPIPQGLAAKLDKKEVGVVHGDVARLPLRPLTHRKFDAVSCTNVLYQLDYSNRLFALSNVCACVKPGGLLAVDWDDKNWDVPRDLQEVYGLSHIRDDIYIKSFFQDNP